MTITPAQYRLIKHGLILLLLGLFGGTALTWSLTKVISLPPIPFEIDYEIPGTPARWQRVHTGTIMNALMAFAFAFVFLFCDVTNKLANRLSWAIVASVWGNFLFYLFGVFAPNRGLSLGTNIQGESSIAGVLAFLPATIAAYVTIVVIIILLKKLKRP